MNISESVCQQGHRRQAKAMGTLVSEPYFEQRIAIQKDNRKYMNERVLRVVPFLEAAIDDLNFTAQIQRILV